jgi:hypothetical protein
MSIIPKIIHYCWFGGNPLPPLALKCIESWKKYCPDYEIKEWNENNFNVNYNMYTKEAHQTKKWAFVSDVARLYAIHTDGGVYLDTDVELIKPIDSFLDNSMFIGFENDTLINTGIGFGAVQRFHIIKKMLDIYDNVSFINFDGSFNIEPCPAYNTPIIEQEGFAVNNTKQTINNVTVYPTEYFCPKNCVTRRLHITEKTHAIHHFDGSWLTDERQEYVVIAEYQKKCGRKLGNFLYAIMAFCTFRKNGIKILFKKLNTG